MSAQSTVDIAPPNQPSDRTDAAQPNFDSLARTYRWMEYLSFGPLLERCRFHLLSECTDARRALVLGDGDGRFTARLLAINKKVTIDAVDSSAAMLAKLHRSARRADLNVELRLRTIHADLRQWMPDTNDYDLVVSHFFLDCLTDDGVEALVERTLPHLSQDAHWLISEFAIPDGRCRRACAHLLIRTLYFVFARMTRLRVKHLPDYAASMQRHGFRRGQHASFLGGLLTGEIWERSAK